MRRPLLTDKNFQKQLDELGYVIIPNMFSSQSISEAYKLYKLYFKEENTSDPMYWNSIWNLSPLLKNELSNNLKELFLPQLIERVENFEVMFMSIMVKLCNKDAVCEPHRDFSVLDEEVEEYYNAWTPLVDTDKKNGALFFLPESNNKLPEILPMLTDCPYLKYRETIKQRAVTCFAKKGDLVIYKEKTVHGSWANNTLEPRPNIHFGVLPSNPKLMFLKYNEDQNVEMYEVDKAFYLNDNFSTDVAHHKLKRTLVKPSYTLTKSDFEELWKV